MFVFREGRCVLPARPMLDRLVAGLKELASPAEGDTLLDALLRAGELECALADRGSRAAARMMTVTDALAEALVTRQPPPVSALIETLAHIHPAESMSVSPPEGFAYYALHPLNFSDLAATVAVEGEAAAIIGIRSIGTILSAIVKAALEHRGVNAERVTVRPYGHPFDRALRFSGEDLRWVARQRRRGAAFFVVDEGPGLSGSSFLSVGEALTACRVPASRITFLCSREAGVHTLLARDATTRWTAFRSRWVRPNDQLPPDAAQYIGGGIWRAHFIGPEADWPACWTQTERLKFFSRDRRRIYKFEGLGRFGAEVRERASTLADGGFGPLPQECGNGFIAYGVAPGRALRPRDVSAELLDQFARYCAFRAAEFQVSRPPTLLHPMVQFNCAQEFGLEPDSDPSVFAAARPIITDSHLLPHEWLATDRGLLKLDGASHGDDHFYPGPTDIAWDLAGAIVEWNLEGDARDYFVHRYRRASGDDPRARLRPYLLAYTMFRLGYAKMAAEAMRGSDEEPRLIRDYHRYRALARTQLGTSPRAADARMAAD